MKENKYIKALILKPALEEINNKTDLNITYKEHFKKGKNGKKQLASFEFKIKLQDEDIINNIKVIKWGLDEDYILGEKN